jgi:aminopeptidase N
MKARLALAVAIIAAWSSTSPAQRLTRAVVPEHYDIHLSPDFSTDTFAGELSLRVRLARPSRSITLNAAEIEFQTVTITAAGTQQTAAVALDRAAETATFTVPELIAESATIAIRYTGTLNDKLRGFYLSQANGRDYAITQLEATDARRAFPSFDEPSMKATFAVSATIDARDTAISNGRLLSDTPGPGAGKHTLRFATTKRMSPYLVALAVGDWECIAGRSGSIPIRVCGTPSRKDELGFALESAELALGYFNRYFSVPYPFEKLDIVAVPDFSAGAMENTGAIFFRERFLVVPADGGTTEGRKRTAQYVAHEIAHQWFGDLVTMEWWDDIWLNEGFATWMEYRPMEEFRPEWNGAVAEVRDTQRAMDLDALEATRPIRTKVETPDEINQVFDGIAYQKTAAVVRMVEGYSGAASFRDGINAYLKKFAFANATGEAFWTTIASVTKKPVDRIIRSFVMQSSMPLLGVDARCIGGATELSMSQRPLSDAVPASTTWEIPVCYKRDRNGSPGPAACVLLSSASQTVKLDGCSSWLFANADGRGYYRTTYDSSHLRSLGQAVEAGDLTPREQITLVEDLWALMRLDRQSIADYLSIANQLVRRTPSPATATALGRINYVSERLVDEPLQPAFRTWIRQAVRPLVERLGWFPEAGESEDFQELRSTALFTMGNAGRDPAVLREARRLVDLHLAGSVKLDPAILETALQLAAIEGDVNLYDQYLSRVTGTGDEQYFYLGGLAFFEEPGLRKRTLEFALSPDIRTQDAPMVVQLLMQRPAGAETWKQLKSNWEQVERLLGIFQGTPRVIGSLQYLCDNGVGQDIEAFFTEHSTAGTDRTLRRALESIQRCARTRSAQAKNLEAFLQSN